MFGACSPPPPARAPASCRPAATRHSACTRDTSRSTTDAEESRRLRSACRCWLLLLAAVAGCRRWLSCCGSGGASHALPWQGVDQCYHAELSQTLTATVMTPSLPTRSIARAMSCPISVSPLAEMVPTCRHRSLPSNFVDCYSRSLITVSVRIDFAAVTLAVPRQMSPQCGSVHGLSMRVGHHASLSLCSPTCAISSVVEIIFARPLSSAMTCSTPICTPLRISCGAMPAAADLQLSL